MRGGRRAGVGRDGTGIENRDETAREREEREEEGGKGEGEEVGSACDDNDEGKEAAGASAADKSIRFRALRRSTARIRLDQEYRTPLICRNPHAMLEHI